MVRLSTIVSALDNEMLRKEAAHQLKRPLSKASVSSSEQPTSPSPVNDVHCDTSHEHSTGQFERERWKGGVVVLLLVIFFFYLQKGSADDCIEDRQPQVSVSPIPDDLINDNKDEPVTNPDDAQVKCKAL